MIKPEYKHSEITEQVIGCAIIELLKTNLQVEREISQDVYYDDKLVGKRKVDFLINKIILVEIKAASCFDSGTSIKSLITLKHFD